MSQDAVFTELRLGIESTLGTPPTGTVYPLWVIDSGIKRERNWKRPNIRTGTRRRLPMRVVASQGSAALKMPLIFDQARPLYESLMLNSRGAAIGPISDDDISFDATTPGDNSIERAGGLSVFPVGAFVSIRYDDAPGLNNRVVGPVLDSSSTKLVVPDGQLVTEAAGAAITLGIIPLHDKAVPALSDDRALSIQEKAVILDSYNRVSGGRLDVATWNFADEDFIQEQFDIKGFSPVRSDSAVMGSGNVSGWPKAPRAMAANQDLQEIYIGSVALGTRSLAFSSLQVAMRNNRVDVKSVANGGRGPRDRRYSAFDVEFSGAAYLDADTLALLSSIDDEDSLFAFTWAEDPDGNRMVWAAAAGTADGEFQLGEAGSLAEFGDFKFMAHDPARDPNSDFYNAGSGVGYQGALFFDPAPAP